MIKIFLDKDKKPISEFSTNVTSYIQCVRESKRPIVLTQNGKNEAVLMDIAQYEALLEELDLLRDIDKGLEAYRKADYVSHEEAKKQILSNSLK